MQPLDPAKVVIIGEEPSRSALAKTLRVGGYAVNESSKADAERVIAHEAPDLIVARLADHNELASCPSLKLTFRTGIPVILVSNIFNQSKCRVKGLQDGGDACLAEPVEPSELLAQVKCLLR